MIGYLALALFVATIPAANWLIGNVGTVCVPKGPCLIPVGFGFDAPSGVLMIGLTLVLRDIVHRELGWKWAVGAILTGAALSAYVAPPALVIALATAFLLSELADLAVYAPLYLSPEPALPRRPSTPPARAETPSVGPESVFSAAPVTRYHTFKVLSPEPEITRRPSALTATAETPSV